MKHFWTRAWMVIVCGAAAMGSAEARARAQATEPGWTVLPREGAAVIEVLAGEGAERAAPQDFSAVVRAGWTPTALRVRVEVNDSTRGHEAGAGPLKQDGVELHAGAPGAGRLQMVATRADSPVVYFDYRNARLRAERPAQAEAKRAETSEGNGYAVEFSMPWEMLGLEAKDGAELELRVVVNNAGPGGARMLRWVPEGRAYRWDEMVRARLGETASGEAEAAAWGGWRELARPVVQVVARADWAGREIEWTRANGASVRAVLAREGGVATATLTGEAGEDDEAEARLWLDGREWRRVALGDAARERERALRAALAGRGGPTWLRPEWAEVFVGETLPAPRWRESEELRAAFGELAVRAEFFNGRVERVERAERPGRYAIIATVSASRLARPVEVMRTLFRVDDADKEQAEGPGAAVRLAAWAEGEVDEREAARVDRAWWHALDEKRGAEIRYGRAVLSAGEEAEAGENGWPLIVFLHGSGGGRAPWRPQDEPVWRHAERAGARRLFVLLSLRSDGGWSPPAVAAAVRAVMAEERIDADRVYLTGFSMGGVGTWATALDYPELFAAIAPVGGAEGEPERAARLRGVPAFVFNGGLDYATTSAEALQMVEALRAAGGEVKWREYPQADHGESLNLAYGSDELYAWLLAQRRAR